MNPGEILADALELPPEKRDAFLQRACAGDKTLLAEVNSLLEAYARADGLLPSDWLLKAVPGLSGGDLLAPVSPEKEVGRRIGAYRLSRVLGSGGMGAVYLAERSDAKFVKQVAIKLVRPGLWAEEVLQRFVTERQLLANLEHHNIARLLDGGATDDGLPYIVMEYVVGIPIDQHADARRLPVPERLRLFLQVCEAVAFAHRSLVVHRDIKPGNILVDGQGTPKLLDFGIAKILVAGGAGPTAPMTRTGLRFLTPEYASPEQVRGEPVTTATDVYSLGVLLYELLTGRRPYRIASRSPAELERTICQTEPDRPSLAVMDGRGAREREAGSPDSEALARARGTQPDRLSRLIAGDLDNIVLMALRKEPDRRYPSIEKFAEDVRRHLEGQPVAARKDTWRYRTAKFARRNKVAVGAAASIFVLVCAFAAVMAVQAERLARERDRARREAESARRVSQFLTDLFKVPQPEQSRGNAVTAREILEAGTRKIQEGLEDEPAVRAELLRTMGNTYRSLGLYEPACSLLVEAVEMQTKLYGPDDSEHLSYALMDQAAAYRAIGRLDESRALCERALRIRAAAQRPDHLDMALLHNNYGSVLFDLGDYEAARKEFETAVAIWDTALGPGHEETVGALRSLAHIVLQDRDFEGAERYAQRGLEISEARYGSDHPETISGLSTLGVVYGTWGRNEDAVPVLERALPISERVFGSEHGETARIINTLAGAHLELGHRPEARDLFLRALAIRRSTMGPRHHTVANTLYHLAAVEGDLGETDSALAHFAETTSILEETVGPEHPNLPFNLIQHGKLLVKMGRQAEAEPLYARADRIWEKHFGPNHPRIVLILRAEGELEWSRRRLQEAEAIYARAYKICADSLAVDHPDRILTCKDYARLLREMGDEARAAEIEVK
jgi:serine/threonine-protein kinase